MEEVLGLVFQFVFEVLIQALGGTAIDLVAGCFRNSDDEGCAWFLIHLALGAATGGLSLLIAPTVFLPTPGLRVANLVVAPLAAGFLATLVAGAAKFSGAASSHFWRGFAYALAFGVIRFAYCGR